jgi:hypothetical protein
MRQLASYPRQNGVAAALRELGRLERTLFTLDWIEDAELRRRTSRELNKGESRNSLARAAFIHRLGEIRDRTYENQQHRGLGLNLLAWPSSFGTPAISIAPSPPCTRPRRSQTNYLRICRRSLGARQSDRRLRLGVHGSGNGKPSRIPAASATARSRLAGGLSSAFVPLCYKNARFVSSGLSGDNDFGQIQAPRPNP